MTLLLALSPHLDDAVFSAGGALAIAADGGARVIVATLFAGSVATPTGFALACQTDKGLPADLDYMALRRDEDRAACEAIGAEPWHGPLREAPHRGYDSAAALFATPHADDDGGGLAPTIKALIEGMAPDAIWAPRAIGGHVDHRLVTRALRALVAERPVVWWTDWPYADRPDAPDPETAVLGETERITIPLPPAMLARKATACAAYRSQLGFQFGGEAAMRARLSGQTAEMVLLAAG